MTLTAKEYESLFATSGGGANDVSSIISKVENIFDDERSGGMKYYLEHPDFGPLIFAIKQLQKEIDYLRTEISANKDKTGITSSQASAITANTAKTSFPGLGTTSNTALAGDTKVISLGSNTTYAFSDLVDNRGNFSIRITAIRDFGRGPVMKSMDLRLI
mgnify:CR=1 FL=1|tara:strand:- start:415 stop:894 length:480 start_codon:yes stop_codon:yes gene_type:complete